ncbi:hypothetical protein WG936_08900 [Corynebacterium sp. H127]|uniref:FtsX-like permease family protein n=1 Tax=Corynebacterium sp. H127 TaxID=3133418 RepID=UPI0030AD5D67
MIRLARRDIVKHWKRSLVAILLLAMPTLILTTFLSLVHTAVYLEEYPENVYTYANNATQPREDFHRVYRGQTAASANGESVNQWVTAHDYADAPPPGTVIISRGVARALGLSVGDTVDIGTAALTVYDLRYPDNIVANVADGAQLGLDDDVWWATTERVAAGDPTFSGIFVEEGQPLPPRLSRFIVGFFASGFSATMLLSLFALMTIIVAALSAPLFVMAHTRLRRIQQQLDFIGARKSRIDAILRWEALLLGIAGGGLGLFASGVLSAATGYFFIDEKVQWAWDTGLIFVALTLASALSSAQIALRGSQRGALRTWQRWLGPSILVFGCLVLLEPSIGPFLGMPVACLGAALCGPWIIGILAALAKHVPSVTAMSIRDAERNHKRTSAAIASITATSIAIGVLSIALPGFMNPNQGLSNGVIAKANVPVTSQENFLPLLTALEEDFGPRVDIYATEDYSYDSGGTAWYPLGIYAYDIVADPAIVDMLVIDPESRKAAREKLQAGETIKASELGIAAPGKLSARPDSGEKSKYVASLFPDSPTTIQQLKLHRLSQTSGMEIGAANENKSLLTVTLLMVGLGVLFIVSIIAMVLVLAAAESRTDRRCLDDIGAGPKTMRKYLATQAALITIPSVFLGFALTIVILAIFRGSFWFSGPMAPF